MRIPSARDVVAASIARFREDVEAETLRLFRLHLQVTVRTASPLALALARHEGVDLDERLGRLRPSPRWLASPALSDIPGASVRPPSRAPARHPFRQAYASSVAMVDYERADGPLSFDVAQGTLQVMGRIGPCSVHTVRSNARLTLPPGMPDTLLEAMDGRAVDAVVDHPVLAGRGYVVRRVAPNSLGHAAALLFGTGLVRFEMPWRDLLLEEVARARFLGRDGRRGTVTPELMEV